VDLCRIIVEDHGAMADSQQPNPLPDAHDPDVADRDAQVEQLLLTGLDHYFAARYDQAIHIWTRVLFLDRGHARARAYIERARSAQAERHRESLELLHHGADAFDRGDAPTARRLLSTAVEHGAPPEEAQALLERLDRLDVASGRGAPAPKVRARRAPDRPPHVAARPASSLALPITLLLIVILAVAAALYLISSWDRLERWFAFGATPQVTSAAAVPAAPVVVPTAAEAALVRARMLVGKRLNEPDDPIRGDDERVLREALRALDAVKAGDALRGEADQLRAAIQRALISNVDRQTAVPSAAPPGNPR
jgi:hypothetical protein